MFEHHKDTLNNFFIILKHWVSGLISQPKCDLLFKWNFKKMCKNLPILDLPNEEDDLIVEADASDEHWSAVLKIIKGDKLCKYCSGSFNKAECNYPTMEKKIIAVIRGTEKFLIFLSLKPFPIRTDCKGILNFVKKNLSNIQAQGRLLRWQLWLN